MKKLFTAFAIMIFFNSGSAQDTKFVADMEAALTIHDTASTVTSEIIALDLFRNLCKQYDKEWLPHYWTAYLLTQVARLKGRAPDFPKNLDPKHLIEESQKRFDTANRNLSNKSDIQKSDFHMLQGFIYGWVASLVATTESAKTKYKQLRADEYKAAVRKNPRSSLMYVRVGIDLTKGEDSDYMDVMAGIGLLNYANEIFSREPKRSMTTYWNKDFIPFWRDRAEKRLKEILNEK